MPLTELDRYSVAQLQMGFAFLCTYDFGRCGKVASSQGDMAAKIYLSGAGTLGLLLYSLLATSQQLAYG